MLVELLRAEGFQRGNRRRTTRRNISPCHLPEAMGSLSNRERTPSTKSTPNAATALQAQGGVVFAERGNQALIVETLEENL